MQAHLSRCIPSLVLVGGLLVSGCSPGKPTPTEAKSGSSSSPTSPSQTIPSQTGGDVGSGQRGAGSIKPRPGGSEGRVTPGARTADQEARPGSAASEEGYDIISEERAEDWWRVAPILLAPKEPGARRWFALSSDGGVKGDPESQPASLTLITEAGGKSVYDSDVYEIILAGGTLVGMGNASQQRLSPLPGAEPVVVRGSKVGSCWVQKKEEGTGIRYLAWMDRDRRGQEFQRVVFLRDTTYPDCRSAARFVDRLVEM